MFIINHLRGLPKRRKEGMRESSLLKKLQLPTKFPAKENFIKNTCENTCNFFCKRLFTENTCESCCLNNNIIYLFL